MTRREITSLVLKLLAIYMLVQMIRAIPNLFSVYSSGQEFYEANYSAMALQAAAAAAIIIGIAAAFLVWQLANQALESVSNDDQGKDLSGLEPTIFAALGLYLLIDALAVLSYLASNAYMQYVTTIDNDIALGTTVELFVFGIQAAISLSLIFKSEGWARLLRKARTAGLAK